MSAKCNLKLYNNISKFNDNILRQRSVLNILISLLFIIINRSEVATGSRKSGGKISQESLDTVYKKMSLMHYNRIELSIIHHYTIEILHTCLANIQQIHHDFFSI